jgi:SAM-dependent methyltransferase
MKLYNELAEYYYSIENNHRDISHDISLIRSITSGKEHPSVLDLGCGTGEHMDSLSRLGFSCVGIDKSQEMLKVAIKRFPDAGRYINAEMTSFDFFEEFDLVMSLFGSFNYVITDSDVEKVLWNTWRALRPDGSGLFEIWNSIPIKHIKEKDISHISTTTYHGTRIERERGFRILDHPHRTVTEVNYIYRIKVDGDVTEVRDRHVMRAFEKDEMEKFVNNNGFTLKSIYTTTQMDPYKDFSNRIIIHIVKS